MIPDSKIIEKIDAMKKKQAARKEELESSMTKLQKQTGIKEKKLRLSTFNSSSQTAVLDRRSRYRCSKVI